MKIVGEKINGTLSKVKKAVEERDADFIRELARRQVEAGAHWLDVNAGTAPDREPDDLIWLAQTVQEAVDAPLCLDSTNNRALEAALGVVQRTPMINSISGERFRLEGTLPLAAGRGCPVIALALDETGIPKDVEGRMRVVRIVMERTRKAGLPDASVFIDPLVAAIATSQDSGLVAWGTMRQVKAEYPEAGFAMGLSNISFGLPARTLVNQAFFTISMAEGLSLAITDPNNRAIMETLYATQAVLGQDRFCLNYTRAFRAGKIGPKPKV